MAHTHSLRPDSKGRIMLGKLASGVSSYEVITQKDGRIILEPRVEIPAREAWLYENKAALKKVRKGLKDAAEGKVASRGSFAQYAKD